MDISVFYRRRKFMYLSIGMIAIIGVMAISQYHEGVPEQYQQAEKSKDGKAVLPKKNESVSTLANTGSASHSVACWIEDSPSYIKCRTNSLWCILPGWRRVPPAPPYCNVIY
jgi:hypothetical protein